MAVNVLLVVILIAVSGFFSLIEVSIISSNKSRIKLIADNGDIKAQKLNEYLEDTTKLLATIQVCITISRFLSSAIVANVFVEHTILFLKSKDIELNYSSLYTVSLIIVTIIITYITLVVCELVPKRIGIKYNEKIALSSMGFMKKLSFITSPFVFLLTKSANFIVRIIGIDPNEVDANITEEEIRLMIDAGEDSGTIDENEKEMINNIFEFNDTLVGDIATHRTDIVALPKTAPFKELIMVAHEKNFSRIPIYGENIDDIVGIFRVKDLLKYFHEYNNITEIEKNFDIEDISMEPYFVPFSKKIDDLFEDMQLNKVHMVIVIDEYGGTSGLVTMEDLLEEIVGNIFDEYEEFDEEIQILGQDTYLIKGTTDLKDVEEFLGIELEDCEDYDTISGYFIGMLGRIPDEDEKKPEMIFNGYLFQVKELNEKRIETFIVTKL